MIPAVGEAAATVRDGALVETLLPTRARAAPSSLHDAGTRPLVMSDVVRELQLIADAAETSGEPAVVQACRRAQSLLARLRNQFLQDVLGDGRPADRPAARRAERPAA